MVDLRAIDGYCTGDQRAQASDCFSKLVLSIAINTANAVYFSRAHVKRKSIDCLRATIVQDFHVLQVQPPFTWLAGAVMNPDRYLAAHHFSGELAWRGLGCFQFVTDAALPHDSDTVGYLHHLFQLVGDEQNCATCLLKFLQTF